MIHSENDSNNLKVTLVLQIKREKVLMQVLPLEILVPVKLLNLPRLNVKKASQKTNIPTKIVKLNADFL